MAWVAEYDGGARDDDMALAVAFDASGQAYVAGYAGGYDGTTEFLTLKYGTDGKRLWARTCPSGNGGRNKATAIAVDGQGNIYVAGALLGSDGHNDLALVRYSPKGDREWVQRYKGGYGTYERRGAFLSLDPAGNIIIGSTLHGAGGLLTLKYSPAGKLLWDRAFYGPIKYDELRAIAIDKWGNVCVTGNSYRGSTWEDFVTVKYSSAGKQLWADRYSGPGSESEKNDFPNALAADRAGNFYVTGQSYNAAGNVDFVTIKYSPLGKRLWVSRYDGAKQADSPTGLAVDPQGNVYVTGLSQREGVFYDILTVKYNATGAKQWASRYISDYYTYFNVPVGLIRDGKGSLYVVYNEWTGGNSSNIVTMKYSPAGALRWAVPYTTSTGVAIPEAFAVDAAGSVYIAGSANGGYDFLQDVLALKYVQR